MKKLDEKGLTSQLTALVAVTWGINNLDETQQELIIYN